MVLAPTNTITRRNVDRPGHNSMFGYLIPAQAQLLGFSVDMIEYGEGGEFFIFGWDPLTNTAHFSESITSNVADFEPFGSGTINLAQAIDIVPNTYLFACSNPTVPFPATGICHITAYLRFL
jgi:hypothetical protein